MHVATENVGLVSPCRKPSSLVKILLLCTLHGPIIRCGGKWFRNHPLKVEHSVIIQLSRWIASGPGPAESPGSPRGAPGRPPGEGILIGYQSFAFALTYARNAW